MAKIIQAENGTKKDVITQKASGFLEKKGLVPHL